ncbi:MAG: M48 family metallopeptidase [Proteobacteria bacterium]|nr:M48 family metallopeptidase [Pseudomonadota bacterium]
MTRAGSADFFELQDDARRATRRLLPFYGLAVVAVAAAVALIAGAFYALFVLFWGGPLPAGVSLSIDLGSPVRSYFSILLHGVPRNFYWTVGGGTLAVMVAASLWRLWQLRAGGEAVAELLDARRVVRGHADAAATRVLNVVEEMAIASGMSVPSVYVMEDERSINALAAGYAANEAVIIVTRAAMLRLTRDELQGVIAHEFSHILNGDMRLNVHLLGLLYGIVFIGQAGEHMVRVSVQGAVGVAREKQQLMPTLLIVGGVLALVGHVGVMAARLIKSAIGRQREFLADAASVQFTRNPDGIAGALDSTRSLRLGTHLLHPHAEDTSHMFFAQAVGTWLGPGFSTHPPIDERIRRVHPRFRIEEYRRTREGIHQLGDVAVIDGGGNVVKSLRAAEPATAVLAIAGVAAAIGHPGRAHLDAATRLIASVPQATRTRLETVAGAEQVMFALVLEKDETARTAELAVLEARRDGPAAAEARAAWQEIAGLGRAYVLPLAELALPVLKEASQKVRDAFVEDLAAVVAADKRVTIAEFVLLTFLRQHLREGAGRPVRSEFSKLVQVAGDARLVLSLIAHAARGDSAAAFAEGAPRLELAVDALLPMNELSLAKVGEALERLRRLAPLGKPRVLRACLDTAAHGGFRLAQAELVRTVAATLDCPVPPVLATLDPATLDA